jgi:hypothetical protein
MSMQRAPSVLALALGLAIGGCATQASTEGGPVVEKEYRTGSHIPSSRSMETKAISRDEVEKGQNSSLNPGASMPTPRGGGG